MKKTQTGWVIINENHPNGGVQMLDESSFSYTRKGAIEKFIKGTSDSWRYWKTQNFKCVRATITICAHVD